MNRSVPAAVALSVAAAVLYLLAGHTASSAQAASYALAAQSTAPAPFVFSGTTRSRGGDTTVTLSLTEVDLYCSSSASDLGQKIDTVRSGPDGLYHFTVTRECEFYNLVGIPPQGYVPYWVLTKGGKGINDSWIQYTQPLQGKELGWNEFWMISAFSVAITPTPFPPATLPTVPAPTATIPASPSPTPGSQATAHTGLPIVEYVIGVAVATVVMVLVRRAMQTWRHRH